MLPYRTAARWVKAFREGRDAVQDNLRTGWSQGENNTVELFASQFDADRRWTVRELTAELVVCHKTFCTTFWVTANLQHFWYPTKFPKYNNGTAIQSRRPCWTLAKGTNCRYGRKLGSLIRTKLEMPIKWMEASRFSSSRGSAHYTLCCEGDADCGVSNTASRSTSKVDGKRYLLLYVPAAPPSSRAQEKTTILCGTELHFPWQFKESHRCWFHGPLAPPGNGKIWNIHHSQPIWVHAITISSPKWNNHCEGPGTTQEMNLPVHSIRNINKDWRTDGVRRLPNIW